MSNEYRLGDGCSIAHGYAFGGMAESADEALPVVVSIGNFNYHGGFRFESTKLQRYVGEYPDRFRLAPGDVLLVMTCQTAGGEILGIPGRVPDDGRLYLHNQRLGKVMVTRPDELDLGYLYYLFLSPQFNAHLVATASGAKILHTAPSRIESYVWPKPPLPIQRRIANILSAYDDLIENNTKRIVSLEEMARSLYREWFVHFRFPGHENTKLVESALGMVPEGWPVVSPAVCAEMLVGFPFKSAGYMSSGVRLLRGDNIAPGVVRWDGAKYWPSDARAEHERYSLQECDVVLAMDRPWIDAGLKVARVSRSDLPAFLVQRVARLRAREAFLQGLLFCALTDPRFVAYVKSITTGANIPHISGPDILRYQIPLAPRPLLERFAALVDPLHVLADRLREGNARLAETRDLLLPRLLSGEIDVSRLPDPQPPVADSA
jgi:type I restriction enzyme S subunit